MYIINSINEYYVFNYISDVPINRFYYYLYLIIINWLSSFFEEQKCTQRKRPRIHVKSIGIQLYLPFSDWFGLKQNSVWFQIYWKMILLIYWMIDLTRIEKIFLFGNIENSEKLNSWFSSENQAGYGVTNNVPFDGPVPSKDQCRWRAAPMDPACF